MKLEIVRNSYVQLLFIKKQEKIDIKNFVFALEDEVEYSDYFIKKILKKIF